MDDFAEEGSATFSEAFQPKMKITPALLAFYILFTICEAASTAAETLDKLVSINRKIYKLQKKQAEAFESLKNEAIGGKSDDAKKRSKKDIEGSLQEIDADNGRSEDLGFNFSSPNAEKPARQRQDAIMDISDEDNVVRDGKPGLHKDTMGKQDGRKDELDNDQKVAHKKETPKAQPKKKTAEVEVDDGVLFSETAQPNKMPIENAKNNVKNANEDAEDVGFMFKEDEPASGKMKRLEDLDDNGFIFNDDNQPSGNNNNNEQTLRKASSDKNAFTPPKKTPQGSKYDNGFTFEEDKQVSVKMNTKRTLNKVTSDTKTIKEDKAASDKTNTNRTVNKEQKETMDEDGFTFNEPAKALMNKNAPDEQEDVGFAFKDDEKTFDGPKKNGADDVGFDFSTANSKPSSSADGTAVHDEGFSFGNRSENKKDTFSSAWQGMICSLQEEAKKFL